MGYFSKENMTLLEVSSLRGGFGRTGSLAVPTPQEATLAPAFLKTSAQELARVHSCNAFMDVSTVRLFQVVF